MSHATNRTVKVFIPFLKATIQVLEEVTGADFLKRNIYNHIGPFNSSDYSVEIALIGDIRSRVIFLFPKNFAEQLASLMMGMPLEEIDEEVLEGTLKEIGNMVSGNAMGLLEEIGVNSDITPPTLFKPQESNLINPETRLGVLEFTSDIGNFQVAIVTSESNEVLKNDVIFAVGFSAEILDMLARFFYPKGIYIISCNEENIERMTKKFSPSLLIYNSEDPTSKQIQPYLESLTNSDQIHLLFLGDESTFQAPFKSVHNHAYENDPYAVMEIIKSTLSDVQLSIYDNRQNIILSIPETKRDAFFLVTTRRGDVEKIPIVTLDFSHIIIDISQHEYINFPERKNLAPKNDAHLQLGEEPLISVEKTQIGKFLDNKHVMILIHRILETELSKVTNYLYKTFSA